MSGDTVSVQMRHALLSVVLVTVGQLGAHSVCCDPSGLADRMCILFAYVGCLISSMFFISVLGHL